MKNRILAFATLFAAVTVAFAFKPEAKKVVGVQFELLNTATPFAPAAYQANTLDPVLDCPSQQKVCVIDVSASDVYTSGANIGKPKVDIATSAVNELSDDITLAISAAHPGDQLSQNGRVIYERN